MSEPRYIFDSCPPVSPGPSFMLAKNGDTWSISFDRVQWSDADDAKARFDRVFNSFDLSRATKKDWMLAESLGFEIRGWLKRNIKLGALVFADGQWSWSKPVREIV